MIVECLYKVTEFYDDYLSYIGLFRKEVIIKYSDIDYIIFDVPIYRNRLSEMSQTVVLNIFIGKKRYSRPIPFSLNGKLEKFFRDKDIKIKKKFNEERNYGD